MKQSFFYFKTIVFFRVSIFILLLGLQIGFSQTTADIELVQTQSSIKIVDPDLMLTLTIRNNGVSSVSSSDIFLTLTINESGKTTYDIIENNTPLSTLGCPSSLASGQTCTLSLQYNLDYKLTQNTWDPTKSWDIVIGIPVNNNSISDPDPNNNVWTRTITSLDAALTLARFLNVQLLSNPVSHIARFSIEVAKPMSIGIVIRDITGRVVNQFPEQEFVQGSHTLGLDLNSLPQGLYLYQVTVDRYPVISHSFFKW